MRILFVHNALPSFVRVDRDILASEHEIDELDLSRPSHLAGMPGRTARADLVYAWFASLHSLGPILTARLLRTPSIVVVGGYDTAALPEIGYGSMGHPLKRHVVRLICASASALLVNSNAAMQEVRRNVRTSTPLFMIHHGIESVRTNVTNERRPVVLTVGNISAESLRRKGHRVFAETAERMPETEFVLAGAILDDAARRLLSSAPPNLRLPGFVSRECLDDLMGSASVYVQASAHEGFGLAVAEAMLHGCIPVVSRRGSLPEVAGESGIYLDDVSAPALEQAVRLAMEATTAQRVAATERIATKFPLERRRSRLLALVSQLASC